ncbi:hypothetical protein CLM62_00045, partial [Streptomyces sp. SA15]
MSTEVVHRLGVVVGAALVLGWLLRWAGAVRRERGVRRRLGELVGTAREASTGPRLRVGEMARQWLPLVSVAGAGWVVVGGVVGAVVGLGVAAGLWRWRLRQAAVEDRAVCDAREAVRQLPLAADLLAACIAAGAAPVTAAQAVGEALGGPVGEGLARGAAEA